MRGDLLNGIALIILGIFSTWLFYILGETDATGPIFIILLGVGVVIISIKDNRRRSKSRNRKKYISKEKNSYDRNRVA
jgi:hypothetical protein